MAEQIISPGVFTRENDLSFLPQGVGAIGAAIVGPTVKGPAFVPTVVRSFAEFERRFGPLSSETYVPQTVREYLRNAGSVTVCRVLAGGGYTFTAGAAESNYVVLAVSSSNTASTAENVLLGVIFPSKQASGTPGLGGSTLVTDTGSSAANGLSLNFNLQLTGSGVSNSQFSGSVNPANANYIFSQLGDSPNNSKTAAAEYGGTPGYTYINFKTLQTAIHSTVAEVSTITVGTDTDGSFSTSSIDSTAAVGNSIVVRDADGYANTIVFSGSDYATQTVLSGSENIISLFGSQTGSAATGFISQKDTANLIAGTIDGLSGFSATTGSTGLIITVTAAEGGSVDDIVSTFPTTDSGTASISTTTQGTNVTGYSGLSSADYLELVHQSGDPVVYSGEIGQTEGYGYATTPYITSQFLDAAKTTKDLFRLHTLDHGKELSREFKISIANLKEPADIDGVEQYSKFSVILRKFGDKDKNPVVLEQYNDVTLDPDSPKFISRMIGDRYPQYNDTLGKVELLGNYPNISNYIRVEVTKAVEERANSPKLSPKGFAAVKDPIIMSKLVLSNVAFPSSSYEGTQQTGTDGTYNSKGYLGWKFTDKEADNLNFNLPLPDGAGSNVSGKFNVENYSGHISSSLWTKSLSASIDVTGVTGPTNGQLKFTVPFQGGDDGIAPYTPKNTGAQILATNLYGFNLQTTGDAGYIGYKKALDILTNQDEYDINMLVTPGVIKTLHPLVTNKAIDVCEERGDAFYVMDLNEVEDSVNTAVSAVSGLDTNYAAVYYPWVKVLDTAKNKPVLVPPSVIVPGAIAASDRIAAEWFAPAGLNRGVLGNVLEAKIRLNQAERDTLYDAKINPIATFPQTGVCIWGQKTLQERSTALDRINVRRLLITLKKFIASSSKYLVFEQNTLQTRTRFLNIVNPYLESVQSKQGLYAFRVTMDESNNTPEVIDRNQLVGAIYLQPTKTAEFIVLDFNVLPTGATFPS